MASAGAREARIAADRIHRALEKMTSGALTVSIGVAEVETERQTNVSALYGAAYRALARAQRRAQDRTCIAAWGEWKPDDAPPDRVPRSSGMRLHAKSAS